MKGFSRLFLVVMVTTAMLISACGGGLPAESDSSVGGNKPLASLVRVEGYIEAISGNQWTINGQVVTVDESILDDDDDLNDYQVGDYIEIKAEVSTDGSLVAREVDSSDDGNENDDDGLGGIGHGLSNDNDDDSNSNDDDDSNDNDDDSNDNDDDDSNDNNDDSNDNDDDDSNDNDDDDNENDD
ncbi:MAG: hypothetical protein HC797_00560 [Anaerolineales bacterium]|nr:hypothetical protein [Anaerolineales bacterium]